MEIVEICNKRNSVKLEDLGKVTLLDWLIDEEKRGSINYHKTIIKLLAFFQEFYKVTKDKFGKQYIMGDINLHNFILKDDMIYGMNFESCKEGCIETDIGKFVAYLITYEPIATDWKFKFANDFIHIFMLNFSLHTVSLIKEIEIELNKIAKRRNTEFQTYDILCRIAEEII
ncbi:hypothetical protein JYG23_11515 [Sedimentibacter sp. zth1]|uniref:hypothetical protein n=1 Tax=Sedimentibacter sp. zth1 TaxID=2816908 RepID=UPI001A936ADC|nr:hypothetical protein [Sedimentibacter sp. zth1]QSX05298.1 hypothetical protein JYG23_11515 [Sedimentibacter sp. zth1]